MLQDVIKGFIAKTFDRVSKDESDFFVENLATLLQAGMGFSRALDAIREDVTSTKFRWMLDEISRQVKNGVPFWQALKKSRALPPYAISIIKFGEDSGKLVDNLFVVARYQQKQRVLRAKLVSAMAYPVIVFGITMIVGTLITWFVLPRLRTVFSSLNLKLPLITRVVLDFGAFLGDYGIIAIPLMLIFTISAVYLLFFFSPTKHIGQKFLFKLPLVGKLIQEIEIARFGQGLGILLGAGSPSLVAIDSIIESTPFRMYRMLYQYVREEFSKGRRLQDAFNSYAGVKELFPASIRQLIATGEESGKLADSLLIIGQRYEEKVEITTKNLPVVLEPILLVIVWLGVMIVAIAVISPLYQLVGQL